MKTQDVRNEAQGNKENMQKVAIAQWVKRIVFHIQGWRFDPSACPAYVLM